MKYLTLVYRNSEIEMSPETFEGYRALTEELAKTGALAGGRPLRPAPERSCSRRMDGKTSARKGAVGLSAHELVGFYLIDCENEADAQEVAARIPDAGHGFVEARPLLQH
ncbi:hypothetical protein DEA8626_03611 [Defluviimonas aquaemixtae]|uniref:YCII-related domain-containing protein n=1 Tax=Albidovulum aquaemixtae TaxID=1542388 RepID=A0A2R8BMB6_9RHOB|nr:YciI family protein [Defluviimonas aquaemixtae]SPH24559.1 hypothetical protein DEA8626_03611 [Defluviimonas aquaemixtae]